MSTFLLRPFRAATYRELAYLLTGGVVAVVAFTVLVTGLATGLGLLITFIGIPILIGTAYANRALAWLERRRASLVLGSPIEHSYRRPARPGVIAIAKTVATDPQTWKDAGWMAVLSIVGFGSAIAALVLWPVALWAVTLPLYSWAIGDYLDSDTETRWQLVELAQRHQWWASVVIGVAGLVLVPLAAWLCAGLAHGQAHLARLLLAPGSGERRVSELTRTRAATVDAQTSELRRIERDLHDGAQARMVAVTLDLGLAKEKLESDPAAARELVEAAHLEATSAIVDLRHLVAGIAPAVLTDRGLDAALSSLVAACRVPVTVDVQLPARLPMAVETAAYFVVAEALTNLQKHAGATQASVHVRVQGGRLVVEVGDDGRGGADPSGSGLTGLRDRVAALDGTLMVVSPPGGPTLLRAEVPCGS